MVLAFKSLSTVRTSWGVAASNANKQTVNPDIQKLGVTRSPRVNVRNSLDRPRQHQSYACHIDTWRFAHTTKWAPLPRQPLEPGPGSHSFGASHDTLHETKCTHLCINIWRSWGHTVLRLGMTQMHVMAWIPSPDMTLQTGLDHSCNQLGSLSMTVTPGHPWVSHQEMKSAPAQVANASESTHEMKCEFKDFEMDDKQASRKRFVIGTNGCELEPSSTPLDQDTRTHVHAKSIRVDLTQLQPRSVKQHVFSCRPWIAKSET